MISNNILILLFTIVCILLASLGLYIKWKFRFWAAQPVFHVYDLGYYLFYSGIIQPELPEKNRYTNFQNIETLTFGKHVRPIHETRFLQLLNRHYLQNGENRFLPKSENLIPYFEGHNSSCFLSFYWEPEVQLDSKTGETIQTSRVVGAMTTRPMHIIIRRFHRDPVIKMDAYYVDYLCVDKDKRKQGIAPQIIQTHHYNQRLLNREIQVSLFKREGQLTGIVPICVFGMHLFSMAKWCQSENILPPYSVVECSGKGNIHHLYDFVRITGAEKMELLMMTEVTNWLALMKTGNVFFYLLLDDRFGVVGAYFFRKSCTHIQANKEALLCFGSLRGNVEEEVFVHGWKQALFTLCLKQKEEHNTTSSGFHYIIVEEISHNHFIIQNLKKKNWPDAVIPAAYFFYNYSHPTFAANQVFVIN